jgi:integrase/recombinase XerD
MMEAYLNNLERQARYSASTLGIVTWWLKSFESYCAGRDPTLLKEKDLLEWGQRLAWTPGPSGRMYSPNTVNQALQTIRRFYRWAASTGRIAANPAAGLKIGHVPRQPKPEPTAAQVRSLLATLDLDTPMGIRDRAILGLILGPKLSHGALARLQLGHVALDAGALMASGRRGGVQSLSDGLCADLERYLNESRPVLVGSQRYEAFFLNRFAQPLSKESVNAVVIRAHRKSGLRPTPSSP